MRKGCTSALNCHGIGQGGLTLGANAVMNLVNVRGVREPILAREAARRQEQLRDHQAGEPTDGRPAMPGDGGQLDSIDLTNLENWINNGAPNN